MPGIRISGSHIAFTLFTLAYLALMILVFAPDGWFRDTGTSAGRIAPPSFGWILERDASPKIELPGDK